MKANRIDLSYYNDVKNKQLAQTEPALPIPTGGEGVLKYLPYVFLVYISLNILYLTGILGSRRKK